MKRCPKGTPRNKNTGECDPTKIVTIFLKAGRKTLKINILYLLKKPIFEERENCK